MQFQILIDEKDTSVALPVKWNALLDERLDERRLSLRTVPTKLYRIGAPVSIKVNDTQRDFIISADESTEIPCGSGYYNHELSLIEPTKILEGIVVESLTFTNNMGRTLVNNQGANLVETRYYGENMKKRTSRPDGGRNGRAEERKFVKCTRITRKQRLSEIQIP